jgi:hypothetical protein
MIQVIISTGDKGGAGKSMAARMIGELMLAEGKDVRFIDCDPANPDTLDVFIDRGCSAVAMDVRNPNSVDQLFETIFNAYNETVFVMDMPAGAGEYLAKEAEVFRALFEEENITCDVVWTINTQKSGVRQLENMAEAFNGIAARYTVVKNHFYAKDDPRNDPFEIWHKSDIRSALLKNELFEANIPNIRSQILLALGGNSLADVVKRKAEGVDTITSVRWGGIFKDIKLDFDHLVNF